MSRPWGPVLRLLPNCDVTFSVHQEVCHTSSLDAVASGVKHFRSLLCALGSHRLCGGTPMSASDVLGGAGSIRGVWGVATQFSKQFEHMCDGLE
eukprot:6955700-Alexandrium_andersonii.AAC.1